MIDGSQRRRGRLLGGNVAHLVLAFALMLVGLCFWDAAAAETGAAQALEIGIAALAIAVSAWCILSGVRALCAILLWRWRRSRPAAPDPG